jgi:hypothetical protein
VKTVILPYGLELRRERKGLRKVWNAYRDGVSLDWSYRHYHDAAVHMETVLGFEATIKELGF